MGIARKNFGDIITFTRASAATRFNHLGQLESVAANVPRIDYDPVTKACRGLLVEEQRTRLNAYAGNLTSGWGHTGGTASAGQSILGIACSTFTEDTTTGGHGSGTDVSCTSGQPYSASFIVKRRVGSRNFSITFGSGGWGANVSVAFDLDAATLSANGGATGSIKSLGGGAFLCTATATATVTTSSSINFGLRTTSGGYTGDGVSSVDLFCQFESGAFPTSMILGSEGSQVTRSADVCSINTLSPWYNQSEGTLFVESSIIGITGSAGCAVSFTPPTGIVDRIIASQYLTTGIRSLGVGISNADTALLTHSQSLWPGLSIKQQQVLSR
jgi:hypothetical protein